MDYYAASISTGEAQRTRPLEILASFKSVTLSRHYNKFTFWEEGVGVELIADEKDVNELPEWEVFEVEKPQQFFRPMFRKFTNLKKKPESELYGLEINLLMAVDAGRKEAPFLILKLWESGNSSSLEARLTAPPETVPRRWEHTHIMEKNQLAMVAEAVMRWDGKKLRIRALPERTLFLLTPEAYVSVSTTENQSGERPRRELVVEAEVFRRMVKYFRRKWAMESVFMKQASEAFEFVIKLSNFSILFTAEALPAE